MARTLIVANDLRTARTYARRHGYHNADVVGGDVNSLRGRHAERVVIIGELDEHTKAVLAPCLAGAEVLYGR